LWSERRPRQAALAFLGAMGLHSVWNALAVGVAVSGMLAIGQGDNPIVVAFLGLLILSFLAILALLALAALVGLIWSGRVLGQRAECL